MKTLHQKGELTVAEIVKIIGEEKANQRDQVSFRADKFSAYFPKGYTAEQMEKSILNMLEDRKKKLQKQRNDARYYHDGRTSFVYKEKYRLVLVRQG